MRFLKKRLMLCFLVPFVLALGLFFFHRPIVTNTLEYNLKSFVLEQLDSELIADDVYRENSSLIIEKPRFKSEKLAFNAERLIFDFKIHPLSFEVELEAVLFQPSIETALSVENLKELFKGFSPKGFIRIKPKLSIREGVILFTPTNEKVYVQLLQDQLKLSCSDPNLEKNTLSANLKKSEIKVSVDQLDLHSLSGICQVLWPEKNELLVDKGTVSANGVLILDNSWPRFIGEASFSDLGFHYFPMQLSGEMGAVVLSMKEDRDNAQILTGKFEILKKIDLTIKKDREEFWKIENLTGGVIFHPKAGAEIAFSGKTLHHGKEQEMVVHGNGHFFDETYPSMNISMVLNPGKQDKVSAHFSMHSSGDNCHCADIQVRNFGVQEYELMQHLLANPQSRWMALKMNHGVVDASLLANFHGLKIAGLKLDKIEANQLQVKDLDLGLAFSIEHLAGDLSVNLYAQKLWEHLNARVNIQGGQIMKNGWTVGNIETVLDIHEGVVNQSIAKATFAGLKGSVEMDWNNPSQLVKLDFKGGTKDLSDILPERLNRGLDLAFNQDEIEISALVKAQTLGAMVNGEIKLNNRNLLNFGFDLERTVNAFWKTWPVPELASSYWENAGFEVTQAVLPAIAAPIVLLEEQFFHQEKGLFGLALRNGWFKANNVPLDKYVSPFTFPNQNMQLEGTGDFEGNFDHAHVSLKYRARDVVLRNEDLSIEIKSLSGPNNEMVCEHHFNLKEFKHFGCIPIQNGFYFEKNSGLLFTDINTHVILEGEKVHLPQVETFCNGVYTCGSLDVDYSNPQKGFFDIYVKAHSLHGKFSQLQEIFAHFKKPLFFLKIPLEGNVNLHPEGASLSLNFKPGDYDIQATFNASLTDGAIAAKTVDMAIRELSLDFTYDHLANELALSDIQGTVLVGDPEHVEEYSLVGDHIRFDDYANNRGDFDVWVGDKKRDVIRLAGKTIPVDEAGKKIEFVLDNNLSHFGDVHPSIFHLVLKEWSDVELFDLELNFKLNTMLHDLQRFSRTGLFFLSRNLIKELNDLKTAGGDFTVDFHYDQNNAALAYELKGEDTSIGPYQFASIELSGRKNKNTWFIDQLQLDHLSVAAEILRTDTSWIINFLGLRYGKSLLIGLEGEYHDGDATLETKVNLFEADLKTLNEESLISDSNVKGQLRGAGKMVFELGKGTTGWIADLDLNASLKNCGLMNIELQNMDNLSCRLNTEKGITLSSLKTALKGQMPNTELGTVEVDQLDYDFLQKKVSLNNVNFEVPVENVQQVLSLLQESFPSVAKPEAVELIQGIKSKGSLKGLTSLELQDTQYRFSLRLPEDDYQFSDQTHHLNQFSLTYDGKELNLSTQYRHEEFLFWLTLQSNDPELHVGTAYLSEQPLGQSTQNPLKVEWMIHPHYGFKIQKAHGELTGLSVNLTQNTQIKPKKDHQYLHGAVYADMSKAQKLFSTPIASAIANWQVGKGFTLEGEWELFPSVAKSGSSDLKFQGMAFGKDFELHGYQFQQMSAHVDHSPNGTFISDLNITDYSAAIHTDRIQITPSDGDKWLVSSPSILVNDFRPSRLQEAGKYASRLEKPLVFRQIELNGFTGTLGEPKTFSAAGYLSFANPKKKNNPHPLFAIPGEILSRIGLDLEVLNPANGTVFFEMRDGRIYLSKFKDVYSQGKLSKFYLANGYDSFVDFQGNLHLQIRMKQYNLLFKLAELFTVTVTGTINRPAYSLNKQPAKKDDPHIAVEDLIQYEAPL